MAVFLSNENRISEIVANFNDVNGTALELLNDERFLFPLFFNNKLYLGNRYRHILLLFDLFPYFNDLNHYLFSYLSMQMNIDEGNFSNVDILLKVLKNDYNSFISCKREKLNVSIYLGVQEEAAIQHELGHCLFSIAPEAKEKAFNRIKQITQATIKEEVSSWSIKDIVTRYFYNQLIKNQQFLEELACDSLSGKYIAYLYNKDLLDVKSSSLQLSQFTRSLVSLQYYNNIKEVKTWNRNLKQHIKTLIFDVVRGAFLDGAILENLDESHLDAFHDCGVNIKDIIVNETNAYQKMLDSITDIGRQNLSLMTTLHADNSNYSKDAKQKLSEDYYIISQKMYDYLISLII